MSEWGITLSSSLISLIAGAMLSLMALGLGSAIIIPGMDRWSKRFFIVLFSDLLLLIVVYFIEYTVYARPELILVEAIVYIIESVIIALPMPMFAIYLLHSCHEDMHGSTYLRAVCLLLIAYLVLELISPFSNFFYTITPQNTFVREQWYPLLIAPLAAIMVLNLVSVIRMRKKLSKKYFFAFLVYLVPLTAAMLAHMLSSAFLFIDIGFAISAYSMYVIILTDQIEQYQLQQQEIAHQRASITVLKMRPHFIYNTMTSIYYLCDQDPKRAQQVTMDFTTYLRKNFSAIASDGTIPFSEELEHTRAYLAVEQAQLEEMLFVDYDIPHVLFRVPPLTLQPIVENAIKHGLNPDSDPLRITIRTRTSNDGSVIEVEDNGPGFDPAITDDPHTTLANIRQRLEMMCNGRLDIVSRQKSGTVVTITIP